MKYLLSVVFLLVASVALAQGPDLGIPEELKPQGQYVTLKPKTEAKAITYIGRSGIDALPADFLADPRWFLLDTRGLQTGRYAFTAIGSLNDVHTRMDFTVVIGDAPPQPVPPSPPQPPQPPTPPGPVVAAEGLHVLIVEETMDRTKLPTSVLYAMIGQELTDYLNTNCAKDANGKPDWALYDDDKTSEQILAMAPYWQQPYKDAVEFAHNNKANPPYVGPFMGKGEQAQWPVILIYNSKATIKPPGILTSFPNKGVVDLVKQYNK